MEKHNIINDNYEMQMNIINNDINNLRREINKKMDSYFIDEEKIIYDIMMKYSIENKKKF